MSGWAILENLVSDLLFILLAIVAGWLWVVLTRRRRLRAFFGVSASKRVVIYVSNLRVLPFGAVGVTGQKMSYQGSAVAHGEMEAANRLRFLFTFLIPSIGGAPNWLSKLLLSDVAAQVLISPAESTKLEAQAPLISLGSPAYNQASSYIEGIGKGGPSFRFGTITVAEVDQAPQVLRPTAYSTDIQVHVYRGGTVSLEEAAQSLGTPPEQPTDEPSAILIHGIPPFTDPLCAFVQRTTDPRNGRSLIYVAGLSEVATVGAASYLVDQWASLHRKFPPHRPFLVMLRIDSLQQGAWSVLFERDLPA